LEQAKGAKVGLIGTNQNLIGDRALPTERTTPESFEVQKLFAEMRSAGCTHVVMEVSSHALYLDRVYGVRYAVGIFTNLTQDHLDFHRTMEAYCDAKAILFRSCDVGVYNADDPWAERLMENATCRKYSYARRADADLRAENIDLGSDHVSFDAVTKDERVKIRVGIPGKFMVYNTLGFLGAAVQLGVSLRESAAILAKVPHVKGRVEVVPTPGQDYTVLIDYAHSPDGLSNVLSSVKEFSKGRTVAVFGCGGDRDNKKRPIMGRIALELADTLVVTSDNPRSEDPELIIADIEKGLAGAPAQKSIHKITDRREAIHFALSHAAPEDVIMIAGKGHENYQILKDKTIHFDDCEVVRDYFKQEK